MKSNKFRENRSIAIIGEGETEWFYFEGLRIANRFPFRIAPDFPQHADIGHFVKLAVKYADEGFDHVVCLIDMDRLMSNPTEMNFYRTIRVQTEKSHHNILFIETRPCTEFWFLLHFLPGLPHKHASSYDELLPELRRYLPGYEKTRRYFRRTNVYTYLIENGSFERAMENAAKLSEMARENTDDNLCFSEIHKVFNLISAVAAQK